MASVEVDAPYLSAFYSVPEPTIHSLLHQPTKESVQSLLQQLADKAKDFEEQAAAKLRLDVELDNVTRNSEKRAQALKGNFERALKDVEELRKKVDIEESSRALVEAELKSIKGSTSTSSTEVDALRTRITTLEASNRDALSLLDAKSTAHDRLAEELSSQHQKTVVLRREVAELETKVQTLENAASSTKYREQSQQQEIDLLKRNVDWHENEAKTRTQEQTRFRKEKNARIAELERASDDAMQRSDSLRKTETQLRNRLVEMDAKLEESLQKAQQLQDSKSRAEDSFRAEVENARRLADLQARAVQTTRDRLAQVQDNLDRANDRAAEEIGELQAQCQSEHSEREAVEARVADLETQVEKLEGELVAARQTTLPPSTPRNGIRGISTPGRAGSPLLTPGTIRQKGGLTVTQLYADNTELKNNLERYKITNAELRKQIDEMLSMVENKQPEIEEMQAENEELREQIQVISGSLNEMKADRDTQARAVRRLKGEVEGLSRDADLLRQQSRDLSNQLTVLLVELQSRDQGLGMLSAAQHAQLQQAAQHGLTEDTLAGMSDTARFVSEHLVIFKNVTELQAQNQQLLKVTREVGERLEREEALEKTRNLQALQQEVEASQERIQQYQDELQALTTRSESYLRERDMFRRMLAHRGQLPPDPEGLFDASVRSSDGHARASTHGVNDLRNTQPNDTQTLLDGIKELQGRFDTFKEEAYTEHNHLKGQNRSLAREKNELQSEMAKYSSKIELQVERYNLLQSNLEILREQNTELQKRSHYESEKAARNDLRVQEVMEELVQANSVAEGMRNESANLKAERELWKSIEARLGEDNRSLMDDRSRLNKMVVDLQNLQNERELTESELRRKLQARLEGLETELANAKRKFEEEQEESKRVRLRREYEDNQSRVRIDDLMKTLTNTKEELIVAKTQRDQLQARVNELKVELRTAEERVNALQPRLTSGPDRISQDAEEAVQSLSREQELELQVTEVKRELDLTRQELEKSKAQVDQYRAIAQSSEEELASLNETSDQYRQETDQKLNERDAKLDEMNKRIEEISNELSARTQELNTAHQQHEAENSQALEARSFHAAEIARLMDDVDRFKETAAFHQEDKKAQAEIAQQAQQNYEVELVKHAEAAKMLQALRVEHGELKAKVAWFQAEAEAAKTSLAQSQESWSETKGTFEREIADLNSRRDDILQQNKLLHEQLDNVSTQIAELKQDRTTAAGADAPAAAETTYDGSQEIIRYLRRDKEIVDVQYELSLTEAKRLQQQLEYAQAQLDQEREKLAAERQKASDSRGLMSHSDLVKSVDQLNLFRESNTTLRHEASQLRAQVAGLNQRIEDLTSELEPIRNRARALENELETKQGEIGLLQKDRDHYQTRVQNILQKYDRVDPAELEALKSQVTTLEEERASAVAEKQSLQEQVDAFEAQLEAARQETRTSVREALTKQFKERSALQSTKIRDKDTEIQTLTERQAQFEQQIETLKAELRTAEAARDEAVISANHASIQSATENGAPEDEGIGFSAEEKAALESRASAAEALAKSEGSRASVLEARVGELQTQVTQLQQELDITTNELTELRTSTGNVAMQNNSMSSEAIDKLQADLDAAQQELETLRSTAATDPMVIVNNSESSTAVSEQVEARVAEMRTQLDSQFEERVKAKDEQFKSRSDNMKQQLNKKLAEYRQERETSIAALKEEHAAELARLRLQNDNSPKTSANPSSTEPGEIDGEERPATLANMTDKEVKDFIANNPTVKGIISRNVKNGVEKVKEEQEKLVEQRIADALADTKSKADEDKAQARAQGEQMATTRAKVQVNMANNRANTAQAKVDYVEAAARDTPSTPVSEVWEVAKTLKPQAAPKPDVGQNPAPAVGAVRQPDPSARPATQAIVTPGQHAARRASTAASNINSQNSAMAIQTISSPTPAERTSTAQSSNPQAATTQTQPGGTVSTLPPKPDMSRTGGNAGTGPAALQAISTQAAQAGRGGSRIPSGSGLPRGAGSMRGRGGAALVNNPQGAQAQGGLPAPAGMSIAGTASAPRANFQSRIQAPGQGRGQGRGRGQQGQQMNATAQQFIPGAQKRGFDGDGEAGNQGKKARGGHNG